MLVFVIWFALVILTLGLALILLPPLYPFVAFFYNGLTVSGRKMGTPGMRLMGLEMRMHEGGARVPFINAAAHAIFFYISWFFPPVFLVSLFDVEKRCVHDMLAGVTVVRRM
ncbi:MAG: RDD family protein [Bradyrhizobium sp.]|nr:MAG: RDD family protein [Bradyrhizobium sp.]